MKTSVRNGALTAPSFQFTEPHVKDLAESTQTSDLDDSQKSLCCLLLRLWLSVKAETGNEFNKFKAALFVQDLRVSETIYVISLGKVTYLYTWKT